MLGKNYSVAHLLKYLQTSMVDNAECHKKVFFKIKKMLIKNQFILWYMISDF